MIRLAWLGAIFAACGEGATPAPPPEPSDDFVLTAAPAPPPVVPKITAIGAGEAADIELRFFGVGELHKGFLSDTAIVGGLGTGLGGCVEGTAQVLARWNAEERVGWLQLKVPPGGLSCMPQPHPEGGWDLSPLVPVAVALANYRDRAAAQYDFRFASFNVGISFTRGAHQCLLRLAGQHPPDGSQFSACVDIAGVQHCTGGGADDGVLRLAHTGAAGSALSACLSR